MTSLCLLLICLAQRVRYTNGVFMEEDQALLVGLALFAEIARLAVKFFVKIYFRLYERRASPPWWDLANRDLKIYDASISTTRPSK